MTAMGHYVQVSMVVTLEDLRTGHVTVRWNQLTGWPAMNGLRMGQRLEIANSDTGEVFRGVVDDWAIGNGFEDQSWDVQLMSKGPSESGVCDGRPWPYCGCECTQRDLGACNECADYDGESPIDGPQERVDDLVNGLLEAGDEY